MELDFRGLQIAIIYEDLPDLIEVRVRAASGSFGGDITAYAPPDAIRLFADALEGFPASATDAREFVFGTPGPETANGAVVFRFACTNLAGHVAVTLQMESDEHPAPPETARFSFAFEPASLDRFVHRLRALRTNAGCAQLPAALPGVEADEGCLAT